MGRKLNYAEPRYKSVVLMNPTAYHWIDDPTIKGCAFKWRGAFTKRNTRVGFVRLDAGTTLTLTPGGATHMLFLVDGSVLADGASRTPHTSFTIDPRSELGKIHAETGSELYYIILPTLAASSTMPQ